ncbi:amidohydrolase family protein [bacterium]|nr:amidohydrolase family protein [bacterium]
MTDKGTVSRRDLISSAAGIAAAGFAASGLRLNSMTTESAAAADNVSRQPRGFIDAHSHIWLPDDSKYPLANGQTVADLKPASFTDNELMAVARPEGVDRVVLIQHSIYHGFDNSYLVDTFHRQPDRFRVVGMVDSRKPGTGAEMRRLLKHGVTGFRITPSVLGDGWLRDAGMKEMWRTAVETRQNMCCLINPSDLPDVGRMCDGFPDTPVVIDHFGRVGVDGRIRPLELLALLKLADHRHVRVKISAYYALGLKRPPHDDLLPMIREVVETFGPERCMWASDCPYQIQGVNNYAASIGLIRDRADFLTEEARDCLLRRTAEQTFFFI